MKGSKNHNFYHQSPAKGSNQFNNLSIIREEDNQNKRMSIVHKKFRHQNSFHSPNLNSSTSGRGKELKKTKSRLKSHLVSPVNRRDNKLLSPHLKSSMNYSVLDQKNKLFERSPDSDNHTRNSPNNRKFGHNMSFSPNNREFSPHMTQSQMNHSHHKNPKDGQRHSNSIMMSPLHRDSVLISPKQPQPAIRRPFGRRGTNYDNTNAKFLKNNFSLPRNKILSPKQRKSKVHNSGIQNRIKISQSGGNFTMIFAEGTNNSRKEGKLNIITHSQPKQYQDD